MRDVGKARLGELHWHSKSRHSPKTFIASSGLVPYGYIVAM